MPPLSSLDDFSDVPTSSQLLRRENFQYLLIDIMEQGRTEVEFDEFEKLLGEIPNAMSGNPHSEESTIQKRLSLNGNLSPFEQGKIIETKRVHQQQATIVAGNPQEPHLPGDHSLAFAFSGLSFTNNPTAPSESRKHCKPLHNSTVITDPQIMPIPSFQIPSSQNMNHFDELEFANFSPENLSMLKVGRENFLPGVPFARTFQGFQYLSNVPVSNLQFPSMSHQQQKQFFLDGQMLPQQKNHQSPVSWRNMEEERYYTAHQHIYLQHLHNYNNNSNNSNNQLLEVPQFPVQANGNVVRGLLSRNLRQQYLDIPISRNQQDQLSNGSLLKNYAIPRSSNQLNAAVLAKDFNAMQILDKGVVRQSLPEKILTRSKGLNTIKLTKCGSIHGNDSIYHVNQNGKVFSASHFVPNFLLDNLSPPKGMFSSETAGNMATTELKSLLRQKYNSIEEVTCRIYLMAKDQHGCRFLQRKFSEGTSKDVENIFVEIIDHIVELMTDPFGNYLVQKLLEVCDEDQRMQILKEITKTSGVLVGISCDVHGTRAVQKVIETLETSEQFSLVVSALKPGILTLIKNINGNHVAQRCLQYLIPEYCSFLYEAAINNCVELATDCHGCCVLQKCLSYSEGKQKCRLISEITSNALVLSQDPFGNYVVQFVFDLELPGAVDNVLDQLDGNYGDLSMQKYSSNVVEKCMKYSRDERCTSIINELINNPRLDQIMQDPYGNYVIQAALNQSKGALHSKLVDAIRLHVPLLRTSPYGKKILSSNTLKK